MKVGIEPSASWLMSTLWELDYVASSESSTTESASDVSPSHLFHPSPSTCRWFSLCDVFVSSLVFCGCLFPSLFCFLFCKCFSMTDNASSLVRIKKNQLCTFSSFATSTSLTCHFHSSFGHVPSSTMACTSWVHNSQLSDLSCHS